MDIPLPTVIRHPRSNLDQTLDQPFYRPFDLFAHEVELPKHVEEIVGQYCHKQTGLVGSESMATRLVPAERVLPLFDPVLNVPTTVVHLDHFPGRELRVGYDESDPREEFPIVPLNLGDHSTLLVPGLCPVPEINQPNLNAALRRSPHGTGQVWINESIQHGIGWEPYEVRDPFTFAILIHFRVGKRRVTSKPEEDESRPIPLHNRIEELQNAIG